MTLKEKNWSQYITGMILHKIPLIAFFGGKRFFMIYIKSGDSLSVINSYELTFWNYAFLKA